MRRCFIILSLIAFLSPLSGADKQPNIVLLLSDDQSWTDYGFMGHEQIGVARIVDLINSGAVSGPDSSGSSTFSPVYVSVAGLTSPTLRRS